MTYLDASLLDWPLPATLARSQVASLANMTEYRVAGLWYSRD
jgi:hypothetical protein